MHTPPRPGRLLAGVGFALATILAGCSSAAVQPSSAPPSQTAEPPAASEPPGASHQPGAIQPDGPIGTDAPPDGGVPGANPPVTGRVVIPRPGQLDVHPIAAQSLSASVDGRRVVVAIDYTSGVEPCNILDSIVVQRGPGSFGITLREGHGPGDTVCIEIAEFRRAIVDLGELEPGRYTISDAAGGAGPISVTVS